MEYRVPARVFESELLVKKSRFIARVVPVSDREEVNRAVAQARTDYPDARHHCWAYVFGRPADASGAGMSDDGEPAGTAGKPILNVLQHGALGDVLVVVIRYFGGVKLGAGGLVRAYGRVTQQALELAPAQTVRELLTLRVRGDYGAEQGLRHLLTKLGGRLVSVGYEDGVQFELELPASAIDELTAYCSAMSYIVEL